MEFSGECGAEVAGDAEEGEGGQVVVVEGDCSGHVTEDLGEEFLGEVCEVCHCFGF